MKLLEFLPDLSYVKNLYEEALKKKELLKKCMDAEPWNKRFRRAKKLTNCKNWKNKKKFVKILFKQIIKLMWKLPRKP